MNTFNHEESKRLVTCKTQEFIYHENNQECYESLFTISKGNKRQMTLCCYDTDDHKRPSECKRFLIEQLNKNAFVDPDNNSDNSIDNTLPPIIPKARLGGKILFSKENPVLPSSLSTPRGGGVDKPVDARLVSLDSLPKINMINVDKFCTQELDKIIELDQESQ